MPRFDTPTKRGRWLLFATVVCFSIGVITGYYMQGDDTEQGVMGTAIHIVDDRTALT